MPIVDQLRALAGRIPEIQSQLETEEATKTALVMPFLQALGYDVFNPLEVVPEFTADVGIKRGEKVDYAILRDGEPAILFECKTSGTVLENHSSQLFRYFATTPARIGILTNGTEYRFHTDLRQPNRMDETPFMVLNLLDYRDEAVAGLLMLSKDGFDIDRMLDSATDLRDRTAAKRLLSAELAKPSDSFVRHFAERIHTGNITQNVIERFRGLLEQCIGDHIAELVNQRLQNAITANTGQPSTSDAETVPETPEGKPDAEIETTVEELEAFFIVKAILRDLVSPSRVASRDVQSYFSVLLDDNNRKPICRFWFNRGQKYLGVFDERKAEARIPIDHPEDIFEHSEAVRKSAQHVL